MADYFPISMGEPRDKLSETPVGSGLNGEGKYKTITAGADDIPASVRATSRWRVNARGGTEGKFRVNYKTNTSKYWLLRALLFGRREKEWRCE